MCIPDIKPWNIKWWNLLWWSTCCIFCQNLDTYICTVQFTFLWITGRDVYRYMYVDARNICIYAVFEIFCLVYRTTFQLVLYPDPYQGLVTRNRILWFWPQWNVVTNQIQDNKSMSPVITNFARIDSMIPKVEMNFRQILEMLHRNAINVKKTSVISNWIHPLKHN